MNSRKLTAVILLSLSVSTPAVADAEIISFDFQGLFTMQQSNGEPLLNSNNDTYGDPTWGYGLRTNISGNLVLDFDTGQGAASINPFNWMDRGDMLIDMDVSYIGDGFGGDGSLFLANGFINWYGYSDMAFSLVWDASGLLDVVSDYPSGIITNGGAVPASDGMSGGLYPIGTIPIATTSYDVSGGVIVGDDGVGGSPLSSLPFSGSSLNIDITEMEMVSAVPLPASLWLLVSGLGVLLGSSAISLRRKN